jgi:hypothetical protein
VDSSSYSTLCYQRAVAAAAPKRPSVSNAADPSAFRVVVRRPAADRAGARPRCRCAVRGRRCRPVELVVLGVAISPHPRRARTLNPFHLPTAMLVSKESLVVLSLAAVARLQAGRVYSPPRARTSSRSSFPTAPVVVDTAWRRRRARRKLTCPRRTRYCRTKRPHLDLSWNCFCPHPCPTNHYPRTLKPKRKKQEAGDGGGEDKTRKNS